jgi:hypothetical protein
LKHVRSLFLFLLLLNILFFAWARWVAPAPSLPGRATRSSDASGSIRLVEELATGESTATRDTEPELPVPAPALPAATTDPAAADELVSCVSAGPYMDNGAAESAAARLSQLGFNSRLRTSMEELLIGSWVRVTNLPSVEDAESTRDALRAAGIAEAYIVNDGSPGITVSLGVFSDAGRAEDVVALARSAGFTAQVSERYRTAQVFWLDMDRAANAGLPNLEDLRGPGIAPASFELRACPESALIGAAVE